MFLDLDKSPVKMKLVYQLAVDLQNDPEHVASAQALTLDESRPYLGLKGTYGLFGSEQWLSNLRNGVMATKYVVGIITSVYTAGQDSTDEDPPNAFDLLTDDGTETSDSFYANDEADLALFKVGARVEALYALDPLKYSHGERRYSETTVEMAVSVDS